MGVSTSREVIRDKASDADTDDSDEEYFVTPVTLYLYVVILYLCDTL